MAVLKIGPMRAFEFTIKGVGGLFRPVDVGFVAFSIYTR